MNKYNAKRTTAGGFTFDSQKEAARWMELRMLERAGHVQGLTRQPEFVLLADFTHDGKKVRGIKYRADFQYTQAGKVIIEDVKGVCTKDYLIKKKLFLSKFPDLIHKET